MTNLQFDYEKAIADINQINTRLFELDALTAANSHERSILMRNLKKLTRLASELAEELGTQSVTVQPIEEPRSPAKIALGVIGFSLVAAVALLAVGLFAPQSPAEAVEVQSTVQPEETAVIESSQAVEDAVEAVTVAPRVLTSTDGKPNADQIQTVKEICLVSFDERYSDKMAGWNITREEFGRQCEADLLGIAWAESRFNCSKYKVDDIEESYGCFMINMDYHAGSLGEDIEEAIEKANDFSFAAAWTLERLVKHGYPRYRTAAIKAHNGSGAAADAYAQDVKAWSGNYINQ